MINRYTLIVAVLLGALTTGAAQSADYKSGALVISNLWSKPTPPAARTGAGFMAIKNLGVKSDRLLSVTSPIAANVEIHQTSMTNNIMRMRALPNGAEITPGAMVMLKPGGIHIMFMGLKKPILAGDEIPATLQFKNAGKINVHFTVKKSGSRTMNHDMHK